MNNQAKAYRLLLSVDDGAQLTLTQFGSEVGSKGTAKRLVNGLRAQGFDLRPGSAAEAYALRLFPPLSEHQRRSLLAAIAYESYGLSGLVRVLADQDQISLDGL